jgi:PAS domain S-box-containing protein
MRASRPAAPAPAEILPNSVDGSALLAAILVSPRGHVLGVNKELERLLGYPSREALLKTHVRDDLLKQADDWACWAQVAADGDAKDVETEFVASDGRSVHLRGRLERVMQHKGSAASVRGIFVDETPVHQLRELAIETARAEAALSLAAGLSHDFNNLLTILVGNLYLVSEQVRTDAALHEKVRKARDAAKRGAGLARQLLDVARGGDIDVGASVVGPEKVVESLSPLLKTALGSRIELKTSVASGIPSVLVNRAQLESVVTNLVINARDAIPEGRTGTVTITVGKRDVAAAGTGTLKPGSYLEMVVGDNGCGIPAHLVERVFEPFFSTKAKTKGSGLGLPMVRWFAEKAGGAVSLKSRPGDGTAVTVLLPAHHTEAADTTGLTMPLSSLPTGTEQVIVVADDEEFRATVEQTLSALGYRTVSRNDADDELRAVLVVDAQVCTEPAPRIDALVRRQGGVLGVVVVGECRTDWPMMPVAIGKPFTLPELAKAVQRAAKGV